MADFFSKIKKGIDKGTKIVSAKSNTLIETNKLKSEISSVNRMRKDTLLELGTKVYEQGKEGTFELEYVEELITKISEADVKVLDLEAKIEKILEEEKEKMAEINEDKELVDVEFEDVVDDMKDAAGEAKDAAESVAEDLKDKAEDMAGDAKDAVEDFVDDVKKEF